MGHVIKNITLHVGMRHSCRGKCVIDNSCASFNIGPSINDQVLCQLSDSDHVRHPEDLKPRDEFTYTGTEVRLPKKSRIPPCNSADCLMTELRKRITCRKLLLDYGERQKHANLNNGEVFPPWVRG